MDKFISYYFFELNHKDYMIKYNDHDLLAEIYVKDGIQMRYKETIEIDTMFDTTTENFKQLIKKGVTRRWTTNDFMTHTCIPSFLV